MNAARASPANRVFFIGQSSTAQSRINNATEKPSRAGRAGFFDFHDSELARVCDTPRVVVTGGRCECSAAVDAGLVRAHADDRDPYAERRALLAGRKRRRAPPCGG